MNPVLPEIKQEILKQEKERQLVEKTVTSFWTEHGYNTVIHAAHTDVVIAPKSMLGDIVNPEISKHLIQTILATITAKTIVAEEVVITQETIQFIKNKQCLAEVPSPPILSKVGSKVSDRIGGELAQRENMWGERYLIPKENGHYTFAEIMEPTGRFLQDQNTPSPNPLRAMILYLKKA